MTALTPQRARAVDLLVGGSSKVQAARDLGIRRETLFAWLQRPEVQEALSESLDALRAEVRERQAGLVSQGLDRLADLIRSPDERVALGAVRVAVSLVQPEESVAETMALQERVQVVLATVRGELTGGAE